MFGDTQAFSCPCILPQKELKESKTLLILGDDEAIQNQDVTEM